MHTLLLRLAGPMQSWGTQSRFLERDTGMEPSKSGVLGMLCAALGRRREDPIDDLAVLIMGVRVDREGVLRRDFQTARGVARASDKVRTGERNEQLQQDLEEDSSRSVVSNRYYLADADFLVGLEGNDLTLLERADDALRAPHWPLSLGRKAFVPGLPVRLAHGGVRPNTDLRTALCGEAWPPERTRLRVVLETAPTGVTTRRIDQPSPGAAFQHRRFGPRHVLIDFWESDCGTDESPKGKATDV
jgi:CRISPR system Cascade subunit CasD